ncbi:Staphylococcal respiratory response protein A [Nocardiopsis dassonvillei]|uniref:Two component transcriptional regulator, winged helix family n=2 Tax=Nocardiopsidaceae TaxID=83676 RepID=D7B393_NOCDD|nr:putative two component transcriptional regulator, winged helix family [Nocardiopsis dassonvillei subsp. dassonvillei DSM 43111]VEI86494.1 Staphylococcal respiratory response protein A [Nocardiopsis dassonvillei]
MGSMPSAHSPLGAPPAPAPPRNPPPTAGGPGSEHSLLGVLPLPGGDRYMLVYGVVVDEPRTPDRPPPRVRAGLLVDRGARRVWSGGREVELTYQEYELLDCLTASPGRAIPREELLERVWSARRGQSSRTIDVHVHRLRRKLGPAGGLITTVRRVGYVYEGPPASVSAVGA